MPAKANYDCDDTLATIYPGANDARGDGFDSDCDGLDGEDQDGDGYASIQSGGFDCDDVNADNLSRDPDRVGDGIDRNCDGHDGMDLTVMVSRLKFPAVPTVMTSAVMYFPIPGMRFGARMCRL